MELELREWLRISFAFGVTNIKKWDYIDINYPYESLHTLLSDTALQNDLYLNAYRAVSSEQIDAAISVCERNGINMVTPDDPYYPDSLRDIANPPAVLYVMGDLSVMESMPRAAIVGARDCSDYSRFAAGRFAYELAGSGVAVISGLAHGIDTAAHEGALQAGGVTAAVLGCGILHDYPRGSMALKKRIARRGAVISEYPPTAKPASENFKIRNRLITGLSDCVLVAQAAERSGSLNSANHAAEQGKELFALPPNDVFDPAYFGQSGLIRDGAHIALSPDDMLGFLRELYSI